MAKKLNGNRHFSVNVCRSFLPGILLEVLSVDHNNWSKSSSLQ